LSAWCAPRVGTRDVQSDLRPRPFDLPWLILDSTAARESWGWEPLRSLESILEEIAAHAEANPGWLDRCAC
jgi:CDP-paratose 2-epimerase